MSAPVCFDCARGNCHYCVTEDATGQPRCCCDTPKEET